jgi:hypothetical protein
MRKPLVTPPNVCGVLLEAFQIVCPRCKQRQFFVSTLKVLAAAEAKAWGWSQIESIWICPECTVKAKNND